MRRVCILPSSSMMFHLSVPFLVAMTCTPPIPFTFAIISLVGPTKSSMQFEMHAEQQLSTAIQKESESYPRLEWLLLVAGMNVNDSHSSATLHSSLML